VGVSPIARWPCAGWCLAQLLHRTPVTQSGLPRQAGRDCHALFPMTPLAKLIPALKLDAEKEGVRPSPQTEELYNEFAFPILCLSGVSNSSSFENAPIRPRGAGWQQATQRSGLPVAPKAGIGQFSGPARRSLAINTPFWAPSDMIPARCSNEFALVGLHARSRWVWHNRSGRSLAVREWAASRIKRACPAALSSDGLNRRTPASRTARRYRTVTPSATDTYWRTARMKFHTYRWTEPTPRWH